MVWFINIFFLPTYIFSILSFFKLLFFCFLYCLTWLGWRSMEKAYDYWLKQENVLVKKTKEKKIGEILLRSQCVFPVWSRPITTTTANNDLIKANRRLWVTVCMQRTQNQIIFVYDANILRKSKKWRDFFYLKEDLSFVVFMCVCVLTCSSDSFILPVQFWMFHSFNFDCSALLCMCLIVFLKFQIW